MHQRGKCVICTDPRVASVYASLELGTQQHTMIRTGAQTTHSMTDGPSTHMCCSGFKHTPLQTLHAVLTQTRNSLAFTYAHCDSDRCRNPRHTRGLCIYLSPVYEGGVMFMLFSGDWPGLPEASSRSMRARS